MNEESNTLSEAMQPIAETVKTTAKRRQPADQDQRITNEISEAALLLQNIEENTEIASLLGVRGVDTENVTRGKALQVAAQASYTFRQNAIGAENAAYAFVLETLTLRKNAYVDFRAFVRIQVPDKNDQTALGLVGKLPQDRQKLVTVMRASYQEAKLPKYAAAMGKAGYNAAALDTLLTEVTDLEDAIAAARNASGAARGATTSRDEAMKLLRSWVSNTKRIARRALRDRPDLLRALRV